MESPSRGSAQPAQLIAPPSALGFSARNVSALTRLAAGIGFRGICSVASLRALASLAFGVTSGPAGQKARWTMSTDERQQDQPTTGEVSTNLLLEVSNAMVRLYKDQFGRGPTRVRSFWAGPDAIACFLEDTLTPAERNLARMGQHQRLRDTRLFFQYATLREFCEPVERKVEGLAVETFVLYPEGEDGPSRRELAGDDEI